MCEGRPSRSDDAWESGPDSDRREARGRGRTSPYLDRIPRMKRLAHSRRHRLVLGIGGLTVASQRSASAMAGAAEQVAGVADARAEQQRASFPFDSEERLRWHFMPNESFPRKGAHLQGDDRAAAGARARAAEDRPQRARLHDGDVDHGARERAGASSKARPAASRATTRPTCSPSSARRATRRRGAGGFEGHHISVRFDVVGGTADRRARPRSSAPIRPKSASTCPAPRRRARACSASRKTPPARCSTRSTTTQRTTAIVLDDGAGRHR